MYYKKYVIVLSKLSSHINNKKKTKFVQNIKIAFKRKTLYSYNDYSKIIDNRNQILISKFIMQNNIS